MKTFLTYLALGLGAVSFAFVTDLRESTWRGFGIAIFLAIVLSVVGWAFSEKAKRRRRLAAIIAGTGVCLTLFSFITLCVGGFNYRALGFIAVAGSCLITGGFVVALKARPRPLRTRYIIS